MADNELRKLGRRELLEILIEQNKEIERLKTELDAVKKELEERKLKIEKTGTLAEAVLAINNVYETADKVAAEYIENVRKHCEEKQREYDEYCENWKKKYFRMKDRKKKIQGSSDKE